MASGPYSVIVGAQSNARLELIRWQLQSAWSLLEPHVGLLDDAACLWEPAPGSWTVTKREGRWRGDWVQPEHAPAPPATIAWHLWQLGALWTALIDHCLGPGATRMEDVDWPGSVADATIWIRGCEERWLAALAGLADGDLDDRTVRWPRDGWPLWRAALWLNLELIKTAAEVGTTLRLYQSVQGFPPRRPAGAQLRFKELSGESGNLIGRFVVRERSGGAEPAILVIGGSDGGIDNAAAQAQAFAEAGLPALAIAYFKAARLPSELREIDLEYFRDALEWLAAQPEADPHRLVVFGVSRGSEAAMLVGAHFGRLVSGVVAAVPSNVVVCSWPPGAPAWMIEGRPLPYQSRFGPPVFVQGAEIPVENIRGPMALIGGGSDRVWPSLAMAQALSDRRRAAGLSGADLLLAYPAASHALGLLLPDRPGLSAEDRRAIEDAWPRILDFIRRVPHRQAEK